MVAQDARDQGAVRGVQRGVEQGHGALTQQLGDVAAHDRARGADHDRTGNVHVVGGGTHVACDVNDAEAIWRFRVHADGAGGDLLMGVDASQSLAHSGCV
ncbi:hypothetical protein GCM10027200_25010 [Lentzea nigeriaca]